MRMRHSIGKFGLGIATALLAASVTAHSTPAGGLVIPLYPAGTLAPPAAAPLRAVWRSVA